ncbi:hypothetical protein L210DRAFT_881288 [Boletus edulis BED1]|uniref:Uncharacterized protein n=1 Tax=Boletus edulis BED1 TaxID=1328754 RepID=A0AAD4C0N0_BOLED|nr:hypothetical protein L210DRAFT_881288 [Boletus edulis BED1]
MNNIPPLPSIEGDLLLDVLTRQSNRNNSSPPDNSEHGGVERLAELGDIVLGMTIMYILFQRTPFLSAADLSERHKELMDDENIKHWLTCYNLKARVRGLEDRSRLDDQTEERTLFSSYVGAVYVQKGFPTLLTWISRLVSPESEPLAAPGGNTAAVPPPPPPYSSTNAPPPSGPPPSIPPPVPMGGAPQVNTLALFNQTCAQRGLVINWEIESEGPPHQPRWSVKCLVNSQLRGSGTGRNQKVAKEEAARQAFHELGWGF